MKCSRVQRGLKNRHSGKIAEFLARLYFRLHGWQIIYKNYITGRGTFAGEVDFIASRGKTLVFVEVKKRSSLEAAAFSITQKQKKRIINAAKCFLKYHDKYNAYNIRFDVVLVSLPLKIKHIPFAWTDDNF